MDERAKLQEGARRLGIAVSSDEAGLLLQYRDVLLELAARVNLTAIVDPEEALELHLLDSLTALRVLDLPEGSAVIDVGSGGGLPGVPLSILRPRWHVVLLDSAGRRVKAALKAVDLAGTPPVEGVHGRAEDVGRDAGRREQFDAAVSRALAPMATLLEYCIPFVKVGGQFLAMKGPGAPGEIAAAKNALKELGCQVEHVDSFTLPFSGAQRSLVAVRKNEPTPSRYPRRAGVPQRRPL